MLGKDKLNQYCRYLFITFYLLSVIGNGIAFAAVPDYSDKEIQKQRTQQQAEEQRRQAQQKDIFLQQGKKADADTSLQAEKVSFVIHTIPLEGQHKEAFPWTDKMLSKYLERRIGMEGINLISGLYSSKPYWAGGLTVRDWLATKSFAEQFEFGMNALKDYGKVARDSAGKWIFTPFE